MSFTSICQAHGWAARYATAQGKVQLPVVVWAFRKSAITKQYRLHGYVMQPDGMLALLSVEEQLATDDGAEFKGYVQGPQACCKRQTTTSNIKVA